MEDINLVRREEERERGEGTWGEMGRMERRREVEGEEGVKWEGCERKRGVKRRMRKEGRWGSKNKR